MLSGLQSRADAFRCMPAGIGLVVFALLSKYPCMTAQPHGHAAPTMNTGQLSFNPGGKAVGNNIYSGIAMPLQQQGYFGPSDAYITNHV